MSRTASQSWRPRCRPVFPAIVLVLVLVLGASATAASADTLSVTLGTPAANGAPQSVTVSGSANSNGFVQAFRQPSTSACAATLPTASGAPLQGHQISSGPFSFTDPNTAAQSDGSYLICAYLHDGSPTDTVAQAGPYTVQKQTPPPPLPPPPVAVTGSASSTGSDSSIMLSGTVNPNGAAATYKFDYGTTAAYGQSTPTYNVSGNTSSTQAVGATISVSGFAPGTTLHFRLEATNAGGTGYGSDEIIATPGGTPTATADPPSSMTAAGFTLNATVLGNGAVSQIGFRYRTGNANFGDTTIGDFHATDNASLSYASNNDGAEHRISLPLRLDANGLDGAREPFPFNGAGSGTPYRGSTFRNAQPDETGYYQLIVFATQGGVQYGPVRTLTTARPTRAPTVTTGGVKFDRPAELGGGTIADLSGSVDDHGQGYSFQAFQVGSTTAYGWFCPAYVPDNPNQTQIQTDSSVPYTVHAGFCGSHTPEIVVPGTTFHYRLVAGNGAFISYGRDETATVPGGSGPPTPAQISSALAASLDVSGPAATVAAILKSGGYPAGGTAPGAGTETISWYEVPPGAHLARAAKPILIASGRKTVSGKGKVTIKLRLTAKGKALLKTVKHGHKLKLTALGFFQAKGSKKATHKTKGISLKP